jgi:hypothetical protein
MYFIIFILLLFIYFEIKVGGIQMLLLLIESIKISTYLQLQTVSKLKNIYIFKKALMFGKTDILFIKRVIKLQNLTTLATDSAGKLHILRRDCHTLSVDGT